MRVLDMDDALVDRDARAHCEDQDSDNESPEIKLATISEGMTRIGFPAGLVLAVEQ